MKKCQSLILLYTFSALCSTAVYAQTPLVVEYQSSPPPQSICHNWITSFSPNDFDFNGDGKRDLIARVGNNLIVRTFSQPDNMVFNGTAAGISLNDYRCLGFHDIAGGPEKELVLAPKSIILQDVLVTSYSLADNQFIPGFSWGASNPPGDYFFGVENTDGDAKAEILAILPGEQLFVLGMGFTPGLTGGDPNEQIKGETPQAESQDLLNFEIQYIAPPHFRWPGNYIYVDPQGRDFNFDQINDYGSIKFDGVDGEIIVVDGGNHEILYNETIPAESLSLNFTSIQFFDVTGQGFKHIMIGGSNTGSGLTDMEIILWLNPQTNEFNTSLMPFLDAGFRVVAIGNPFGMGGTPTAGIIMRHMTTGRVIVVGDGPGFQGGGGNHFTLPEVPETGDWNTYTLHMVYESQVPVQLMMPNKGRFDSAELDANGDGALDIPCLVMQDSVGNDLAGFTVLDGVTMQPIWATNVPAGPIDPAPFFHGFYDANGDGQKEIIYGAETVQTSDGQIHKPFGAGFEIKFIYDLDGDGFEEIIGGTPEGKVQVWSGKTAISSAFEQALQAVLGLAVFPNPSRGRVQLELAHAGGEQVLLRVFDAKGNLVQQQDLGRLASDAAQLSFELPGNLPNGQYFINACSAKGGTGQKIVLER